MVKILTTKASKDYELLDSGEGMKLERFGSMILVRPDPQVLWRKNKPLEWERADAVYERKGQTGKWKIKKEPNIPWTVELEGVVFSLKLLPSKHVGLFPEQASQWQWLSHKIQTEISKGKKVRVLNLFGYTGGASLVAAKAGAEVCHLDASSFAVDKLKENMTLSQLAEAPIRLIVDDVRKFVEREIKRGNQYDLIVLDPPVYGKGLKDEVWNLEENLPSLLTRLKGILSDKPLAVILNGYASIYSHLTYAALLQNLVEGLEGETESGELALEEVSGRLLPTGIYARWENK